MASSVIDPQVGPRLALEGKVVTMDADDRVLSRGVVYIERGQIVAVKSARAKPPDGFEDVAVVRTGDTIYPGLIELHNHLSYNVLPLWNVPRKFAHNGQWKGHIEKRKLVSSPMKVLAKTPGLVEAVVRYVECKALLGGVTTSQGVTLSSAAGIQKRYRGVVRNVEQTGDDPRLPEAVTRVADVADAARFRARLEGQSCLLLHLSEGIGATARKRFAALQLEDGSWAISDALAGIHSAGLEPEDFEVMRRHGGSMVWSPLSNFLLYGATANIAAANRAGIAIGIGGDWSPSGSKNLLGELKVAHLICRNEGGPFEPRDILALATRNAARILKWEDALGSIEPGKAADLLLLNGRRGDPYEKLLEARETTISLVVINGVARYGQPALMERLGPVTEELRVGRSRRALNLAQATADPLVGELTLAEASRRLRESMPILPVLAKRIEAQEDADSGFFSGSVDATGETWQLDLDNEPDAPGVARLDALVGEDAELSPADIVAAGLSLSELVEPMQLDPLTVQDDPTFLPRLMIQRNVPRFVKEGLPELYGRDVPLPDSAKFLSQAEPELAEEMALTMELRAFLASAGDMALTDRVRIVEQALLVVEQHYVHLTLKRSMHGIDPVQRLRLLLHRLQETPADAAGSEIEFHRELLDVFRSLRDLHTAYEPPEPFREVVAFLPFLAEECHDGGRARVMVTRLVGDAGPDSFAPGAELTYWNGTPVAHVIARLADLQAGANPAARRARAIDSLTTRPLRRLPPPDEEWVTLRYRREDGEEDEWTQPWLVFIPRSRMDTVAELEDRDLTEAASLGVDGQTDAVQEAKKRLFAPGAFAAERDGGRTRGPVAEQLATTLPTVLYARPVETQAGEFGYLRIRTFGVRDATEFVEEVERLVAQLPETGLIIDVRGNGGGLIHAAERLLQLFTPRPIHPETTQFSYSQRNLELARRFSGEAPPFGLDLTAWRDSLALAVRTGAEFSLAHPITDPASANDVGQRYYGPVVLVTDARCYSATDMFAAGFQDHEIGPVLGVHETTGAGGANVWTHRLLGRLAAPDDRSHRDLPYGANLTVAIRRTLRVGSQAGTIVEDFGAPTDPAYRHYMTRADLMEGNRDLIERAGQILDDRRSRRFGLKLTVRGTRVSYRARRLDRLDFYLDGRPVESVELGRAQGTVQLPASQAQEVEVRGYAGGELVARSRASLG